MAQVTYGDFTFDTDNAPEASVKALLSRGLTHLFGSEASSKLIGKIRAALTAEWIKDQLPEVKVAKDAPEFDKQSVAAWRDANPDQVGIWAKEIEADFVKAITEGTLGTRVGGPRLDPLDVEIERIAKGEVREQLATLKDVHGNAITPKQYAKGKPIEFGGGQSFTFDELVARRLTRDKDRIEKAARKVLADKARKAEKAKEVAAKATTFEELGL